MKSWGVKLAKGLRVRRENRVLTEERTVVALGGLRRAELGFGGFERGWDEGHVAVAVAVEERESRTSR